MRHTYQPRGGTFGLWVIPFAWWVFGPVVRAVAREAGSVLAEVLLGKSGRRR